MTRVKRGTCAHRRRHKVLKLNRSFSGVHSRLFRQAKQQRLKALRSSFINRKKFQRTSRSLWIQRINSGVRFGWLMANLPPNRISDFRYNIFIFRLKDYEIILNRKIISQMVLLDWESFSQLLAITSSKRKRSNPS